MKRSLLMLSLFAAAVLGAAEVKLPERILSGYTGFFFGMPKDHVLYTIEKMGQYKFNSIDLKIHSTDRRKMDVYKYKHELKEFYDAAKKQGMILQLYLYPKPSVRYPQWEEHAVLPCIVDALGRESRNTFALNDIAVWRQIFAPMYDLAKLQNEIPFASLKIDIETLNFGVSYDTATWKRFCAVNAGLPEDVPASERGKLLKEKGLDEKYIRFFQQEVEKAIKTFADELHAVNPDLILGYMPAHHGWQAQALNRSLATDKTPAIIDGWDLYNGSGWTDKCAMNNQVIRAAHPNNRHVIWLRPDTYDPEDLTVGAYYTAANVDGYSIWVMTMLDEKLSGRMKNLPKGKSYEDIYAAFGKANEAVNADLKANTIKTPNRIKFKAPRVRVAELDYSQITIPELQPLGSGSLEGSAPLNVMRGMSTIFFYVKAGEDIDITLQQLAGSRRPISLHYAVLDSKKNVLREEAVTPGSKAHFKVSAPHTGTFALVVTGGKGQSWYSFASKNPYVAIDGRSEAYMFRLQKFFVAGSDHGNPELKIRSSAGEAFTATFNKDLANVLVSYKNRAGVVKKLPDGIVEVQMGKQDKKDWGENFWVTFPAGKLPLIFPGPHRTMKFAE
ncbi:MAG: hypothetical protein E7057_11335 [Lentisphaerae bacterium]|nr:hypothetical protein [Lentisphaerota bacterium]